MTDIVERLRDATLFPSHRSDIMREAADEIERLTLENWQLKGALGYPVPGHIPNGDFKCGMCEARALADDPSWGTGRKYPPGKRWEP